MSFTLSSNDISDGGVLPDAQVKAKTEQYQTIKRRVLILETAIVELGNYRSEVELIAALEAAP